MTRVAPRRRSARGGAAEHEPTNAIQHAGGIGVVRLWQEHGHLVCEVADYGSDLGHTITGSRPSSDRRRLGLRCIAEVCDHVQVSSGPDGTVIRLHSYPAVVPSQV